MRFTTVFLVFSIFLLSGCATVGQKQAECENNTSVFSEIVSCTKKAMMSNPMAQSNELVKLYFLRGEQLAQKVQHGEITDLDAKVEWQNLYIQLKGKGDRDSAAAISSLKASLPRTTTCSGGYGSTTCTSY